MRPEGMIERVARAICRSNTTPEQCARNYVSLDDSVDGEWEAWISEARAAIEAMRDPPDEAVDAGLMAYNIEGGMLTCDDLAAGYCAIIDFVLKTDAKE